jgi:drug/metabolite transporter (DMT)-like permease
LVAQGRRAFKRLTGARRWPKGEGMSADATAQPAERAGFLDGGGADRPALAATLMVGSLAMLALQDGLVKTASDAVSLWQFQFLRALFNLIMLAALSRLLWGVTLPRPKRIWAVALRSALLVGAMLCFFGGVPYLALSEIAAGLYVFPLFIAALSHLVLGEKVGPRRLAAIIAGFSGTLLILKPGGADFSPVSLMPVGAAFCYACTVLTTRRLCRDESPVTLAYGVGIAFLIVGASGLIAFTGASADTVSWPYLQTGWRGLELWVLGAVLACSCLNLTANIGLAKSYQSAESSWLAPFDYSYLIFATFWGYVFFGDLPDILAAIGMAMIAGGGAYVAWRERREKRLPRANFNRSLR